MGWSITDGEIIAVKGGFIEEVDAKVDEAFEYYYRCTGIAAWGCEDLSHTFPLTTADGWRELVPNISFDKLSDIVEEDRFGCYSDHGCVGYRIFKPVIMPCELPSDVNLKDIRKLTANVTENYYLVFKYNKSVIGNLDECKEYAKQRVLRDYIKSEVCYIIHRKTGKCYKCYLNTKDVKSVTKKAISNEQIVVPIHKFIYCAPYHH